MFPAFCCLLLAALPLRAETVLVDDEDGAPAFRTTSDNWATWSTNGEGFDSSDSSYHYLSHTVGDGSREGTATWTPTLSTAGTWRVETWFRRTENRSTDADHTVTDGSGASHPISIDQSGSGGSGWVLLGEFYCGSGSGGCTVTLDGDDGASDEADAMRFTLVEAGGAPEQDDDEPCVAGTTQTAYAGAVSGDGWSDVSAAQGAPDGDEASSPNVDAGEDLTASAFDLCDPDGDEQISAVRLGVRSRAQYDSGTYDLELQLDGGGAAFAVVHGTTLEWHEVDLSGDRVWTWAALQDLTARLSLYDHPGGERDSDAWVDAFRLEVDTVALASEEAGDSGVATVDTGGQGADPDTADPTDADLDCAAEPDADPADGAVGGVGGTPPGGLVPWPDRGCTQATGAARGAALLGLVGLGVVGLRRRRP